MVRQNIPTWTVQCVHWWRVIWPICVACVVLSSIVGCTQRKSSEPTPSTAPTHEAKTQKSVVKANVKDDTAAPKSASVWTTDGLEHRLRDTGWTILDEAPPRPDIAVPSDTQVHGFRVEKPAHRADIFLYQYPLAGYAKAHQDAAPTIAACAIARQDTALIAVYAKNKTAAQKIVSSVVPKGVKAVSSGATDTDAPSGVSNTP